MILYTIGIYRISVFIRLDFSASSSRVMFCLSSYKITLQSSCHFSILFNSFSMFPLYFQLTFVFAFITHTYVQQRLNNSN